jgi:hypothetical protein
LGVRQEEGCLSGGGGCWQRAAQQEMGGRNGRGVAGARPAAAQRGPVWQRCGDSGSPHIAKQVLALATSIRAFVAPQAPVQAFSPLPRAVRLLVSS